MKRSGTIAFDWKIHGLNNSGKEEGLSTGESCDREKTPAVAEGDRSISPLHTECACDT